MTIPREEFNATMSRLFDKMEEHQEKAATSLTELKVEIAKLQVVTERTVILKQPCSFFDAHVEEHRKAKASWRTPILVSAVMTVALFIQEPIRQFIRSLFK